MELRLHCEEGLGKPIRLNKKRTVTFSVLLVLVLSLFFVPESKATTINMSRTITSLSADGYVFNQSAPFGSYGVTRNASTGTVDGSGANLYVGQRYVADIYMVYRTALYFDTSIIPDNATITSAILSIYISTDGTSTSEFNFTVQNGQPTYPHSPLVSGDYLHTHYDGDGGQRNSSEIGGVGYFNITVTNSSWLNLESTTKLLLRSSRDVNNIASSTSEYVIIDSAEQGSDYAPKLFVEYQTEGFLYILMGAYDELGVRDGAINCTLYRETEAPYTVELDGEENVSSEAVPVAFHFDLGDNESRVYYIKDEFEEIYVFKPSSPFFTYYVTLTDFVGVTDAYLESLLNVNGTDRVVERWKVEVLTDIPFTLSWGVAYKFRLVCNEGTYVFGSVVAEADTTIDLTITSNEFPVDYTSFGLNISVSASRENSTWIQVLYADAGNGTSWVYVDIQTRYGTSAFNSNSSSDSVQVNWYSALNISDYIAKVTISHSTLGTLYYTKSLPSTVEGASPFDFGFLGSSPVDLSQIFALLITLFFGGIASVKNVYAGGFLMLIIASVFGYLGWLNVSVTVLTVCMVFVFMLAFAAYKRGR